jgi:hypothetical protein
MLLRAILFFLLVARSASAQSITTARADSAQTTVTVAIQATSVDTVQALHRLYDQRRTGGFVLTALGGGYFLYTCALAPFALAFGGAGLIPVVVTAVVIGGTTTVINIRKSVRFSKSREAKMVASYERNNKLPSAIRSKLKPKHFSY